jgi:hypothetical protein
VADALVGLYEDTVTLERGSIAVAAAAAPDPKVAEQQRLKEAKAEAYQQELAAVQARNAAAAEDVQRRAAERAARGEEAGFTDLQLMFAQESLPEAPVSLLDALASIASLSKPAVAQAALALFSFSLFFFTGSPTWRL